jgi:hypothetical protein
MTHGSQAASTFLAAVCRLRSVEARGPVSRQNQKLRARFERKVSEILARPLADLQSRGWLPPVLGGFSSVPISREAQSDRMREILERDRAMLEADPPRQEPSQQQPFEVALTPLAALALPSNADVTNETSATQETDEHPSEEAVVLPTEATASPSSPTPRQKVACSEPIRTRTMAKLLLSQGHPRRALSIYEALIAEGASDPVLLAEADALRSLQI